MLLYTYKTIFDVPASLPPNRSQNHSILLVKGASPVKVRPYRYPHSRKDQIEVMIADMLKKGIIVPSTSPFSSPIILVKKKDGTWRFCVDYKALNAITVKDSFPIPTVDELIDELHGTNYFSKLDLRSGYHQILTQNSFLRGFLGLTGYYRKFIKGYASIDAPLSSLLQKDNFYWTEQITITFENLKAAITRAPVLALPDFSKLFTLETDASGMGIGIVLSQEQHPIAFFSKKLTPRMQRQSAYTREFYAITEAVAKFRHYLLGHRFVIKTDQRSLKSLTD
uniref:Retrovirus-related Pol polyprotein from transposon 297 family n=1 Tax=Cajanus cajan TaxID=3821 RepID=A0A151RGP9_CAJCA|nr:Retrovirus-related Pol polyprotein from transposon 297 family [Cajanus cajan]